MNGPSQVPTLRHGIRNRGGLGRLASDGVRAATTAEAQLDCSIAAKGF